MKILNQVERKYTAEICEAVICDLCHKRYPPGWTGARGVVLQTACQIEEGSECADGGYKRISSFDICPACFKSILIPLLKDAGATHSEIEIDY